MITDENGFNYIEHPELPEWQTIHYALKDYRRMYLERNGLETKIHQLHTSINKMNQHVYAQRRIIDKQRKMLKKLVRYMDKQGVFVPADIKEFLSLKY